MGVFEHFPYVNFHELNFDWMVAKIKELEDVIGTQIVDIVARAGVAANAEAISDLSDTVDQNAITAHNESQAASNAAASAQNTADTASSGVTALQTLTTKHMYHDPVAGTLNSNIDQIYRMNIVEVNKLVIGTIGFHTTGQISNSETIMNLPLTSNFDGTYDILVDHTGEFTLATCHNNSKRISCNGVIPANSVCFMDIIASVI